MLKDNSWAEKKELEVSVEVNYVPCPPEKREALRAGLLMLVNLVLHEYAETPTDEWEDSLKSVDFKGGGGGNSLLPLP